jgi:hypothetical protein
MNRFHLLLLVVALAALTGCESFKELMNRDKDRTTKGNEALPKVQPDQLVTYVNERAGRLQTFSAEYVRVVATDHSFTFPALRGSIDASQPRNFRLRATGGAVPATTDLGSNSDQFWVYLDAPTQKPLYVFASHSDFESGKAKLPGGIPFEPDWVMQALNMTTLAPNNHYTVSIDQKARTYTLRWPATTPNGASIIKEIVFEGDDDVQGNKPRIKKHVIRDTKEKVICSAEIKQAKTVRLAGTDPHNSRAPLTVQYPSVVVLKWEEQKFEMKLEVENVTVNKPYTDDQAKTLFTRNIRTDTKPIDLAGGFSFQPR